MLALHLELGQAYWSGRTSLSFDAIATLASAEQNRTWCCTAEGGDFVVGFRNAAQRNEVKEGPARKEVNNEARRMSFTINLSERPATCESRNQEPDLNATFLVRREDTHWSHVLSCLHLPHA